MALKGQMRNNKWNYFILKENINKYLSIKNYAHTVKNWTSTRARFAQGKEVVGRRGNKTLVTKRDRSRTTARRLSTVVSARQVQHEEQQTISVFVPLPG